MSLQLAPDDVDADLALEEPPIQRRELWSAIVDEGLAAWLGDALADVLDGLDAREAHDALADVDALDGRYRDRLVDLAHPTRGSDDRADRLEDLTASLGGPTSDGLPSSLDDVRDGPLALLELADVDVTISLGLPTGWEGATSTERTRWLRWVTRMSASADVLLDVHRARAATLADRHAETLPATACVNARTQTAREAPASVAAEATEELGEGAPAWRVIAALVDDAREVVSVDRLNSDPLLEDVSRSANAHRVSRLEELGLVERTTIGGDAHVRLLPAGALCWEDEDLGPSTSLRGYEAVSPDGGPQVADDSTAGVNDPPKSSPGPCTPTQAREAPQGERPPEEADAVLSDPVAVPDDRADDGWMPWELHHAADVAAPAGGVGLADEPLREDLATADRMVSFDEDRETLVVSVRPSSSIVRTGVRLAAALLDDRVLNTALDVDRVGEDLSGLDEDDEVVLRLARQLGWMVDGGTYRDLRGRLEAARRELLADLADVGDGSDFDHGLASDVLRRAHGLAGVATHLLDLAGVRVVRELRSDYREWSGDGVASLCRWLATQTAITTRYGHYPMYRVLLEDRDEKRDAMLGAPVVDPDDPLGEHLGGWVLRGPGADDFAEPIGSMWSLLEDDVVDEDAPNFAEFGADLDVRSTGREDVAAAASRVCSMRRLDETRTGVTLLHGLTTGVYATVRGLWTLGSQDVGRRRDLRVDEVRLALANLDGVDLLDGLAGSTGELLATLALASDPLSTSELAERAGVSTETVRNRRSELEALGVLDVDDLGSGRATLHRLELAGRADRDDVDVDDPPLPELVDDDMMTVTDAALEALTALGHNPVTDDWERWERVAVDGAGSILDLVPDGWPDGVVRLAARLVDDVQDDRGPPGGPQLSAHIGQTPITGQTTLPDG